MKVYPLFFHDVIQFPKHWEKLMLKDLDEKVDEMKSVRITTCVLLDEAKNVLSMGVCFQSIKDGDNRKEAVKKSRARALAALTVKRNLLPINRPYVSLLFEQMKLKPFTFKAMFEPRQPAIERFLQIIERKKLYDKESIEV